MNPPSASIYSATMLFASISCFAFSAWGFAAGERAEIYGSDNCNADCNETPLIINECRHLSVADNPPNDCQADKCTRNIIFRAKCSVIAEGTDCLFTPPFPGNWVVQERRNATNCTTANPQTWTNHDPGPCEWFHHAETRCETGACDGDKWAPDDPRPANLKYCSH